ncbi:nucleotidyltransferase family protein [Pseudoflavonifractor sp. MSJ-37]|uniref:tRNA(Met) cytidine acetate ligase n=1 Tax=Pseudoflavonifractor sp. MSJ-37 TaxID=2841531 RepID=UPI001C112D7B|nr:nucleotidyltransferase family protein [Pseudoflavonifractor sp. MSJ-37]MBU5434322.1 nucleotidyltransferase family protein [Pseudoflavonifractor sp. MSJ-37]
MSVIGIVAEYDPFHTGHAWHIHQTRQSLDGDGPVVCVMSGNWVQRGGPASTDKWSRAARAVRGGADLVLELPTVWACASAEPFARGAISILAGSGVVDSLSFGSETGELEPLRRAADALEGRAFREALQRQVRTGQSFPAARQAALEELLGPAGAEPLSRPNDSLGIEYLRAVPAGWTVRTVPRRGAAHGEGPAAGFASASHLRDCLRAGEPDRAAPYLTEPWTGPVSDWGRCAPVLMDRVRTMSVADWAALPDSGAAEGLPERLVRCGRTARSPEEFLMLAKTRRYAHARLRRLLVWAFLGLRAADRPEVPLYLRPLAFNGRGRALLGEMKRRASLPILTKPAHIRDLSPEAQALFALEERCTDRFGLCLPDLPPCGEELRRGPVVLP